MGYLSIGNLYKTQDILMFKECYALEKIHGTSSSLIYKNGTLSFFSGGVSHQSFVNLFNQEELAAKLSVGRDGKTPDVTVYGEAYGGSCQKMSDVYGKQLKFVAFDVMIGEYWLSVPDAYDYVVNHLGLEFVDFVKISTDLKELDAQRDRESVQAIRNGMGPGKQREGVVLRPLVELTNNRGDRIMSKHKQAEFRETSAPREVSPDKLKVLSDAEAVATEWVTTIRIQHVLDKIEGGAKIEKMPVILAAMVEDVKREGEGEIVWSPEVDKAIRKATASGVKKYFQDSIKG